jgi:hypothetical protein
MVSSKVKLNFKVQGRCVYLWLFVMPKLIENEIFKI